MDRKIKIGLTGGIGSGKTTVARILESKGYPVFYADDVAKQAYNNSSIKKMVIDLLGQQAYLSNAVLNKVFIAEKVFGNNKLLQRLNAIIHPYVAQQFETWLTQQTKPLVFKEAAILLETGGDKQLDGVVVVIADMEQRITRVMRRDQLSRERVEERLQHQWTDAERLKKANYVIVNDTPEKTLEQVEKCLLEIKEQFNLQSFS
jgi:dephospho-CoA kinase